uniref:Nonstructural polyprotein n=1 Tax=Bundaberg bee virus 1 TaxID=2201284 RepID=A0A2U8JQ79_9VIRU|nr:nonstructural polyprotein [Bundaberg bee virus 1]
MSTDSSTQTNDIKGCTPECHAHSLKEIERRWRNVCPISTTRTTSTIDSFENQHVHVSVSSSESDDECLKIHRDFIWPSTNSFVPSFVQNSNQNLHEAAAAFCEKVRGTIISRADYSTHLHQYFRLSPFQQTKLFNYSTIVDLKDIYLMAFDEDFTYKNVIDRIGCRHIFTAFRSMNRPNFQSTVMDSAYALRWKEKFTLNWKCETSFMKFMKSQPSIFDANYKLYWLWLNDVHNIPFVMYATDDRITAQVGVEVNIPQLADLVSVLDKLSSTFASIVKPDVMDTMKARVATLVTSMYNIIRWCSSKLSTQDLIVNLISSLITLFPTQKIMDCVNYIFRGVTAQSGLQISSQAAIKALFVCFFLVITSQLPGKNTIDGFIVRVKNIPQALKSIAQFHEMVDPIAKECVLFVEEHVMKLDVSASRVKTIDDVTKFSERVAELAEMHKRRQINKDPALAKEAGRLHYDAVRLLGRCINMNYDRTSIEFLRSLLPTTYKISESALASGADMNKIRRKPIVIWLAGQSQIGKTTLIMKLIQDIEKHSSTYFRENGELPHDWEKEIFTCCPENEYMDGYHGQNWVTMDEFNQMRDSVANPSAENFILLRAISQFPYLLHMAALHEKPNSYMSSHGFILTSNSTNIQPESIKTKEAITNRISCPYRMEVREEYRLYFDNNRKYKLDVGKVMRDFGTYTTECYYFVEFDPYTEQDLPGFYTYEQVLWRMIDVYDRETTNFTEYSSFLDNNRSQPLPPRNNSAVYTPPPSSLDSSSSDDEPRRPARRNDYLREWRKAYKPNGPTRNDFSDSPGLKYAHRALAQTGKEEFYDAESYESDIEDDFDVRDYVPSPFWTMPYEVTWRTLSAPFVAFEQVCQRNSRIAKWIPNFVRKITGNVCDEFYLAPAGYTRVYNHSAIKTEPLSKSISAFAQTSIFLTDSECDRVARHVSSFRVWAVNRLKILKETASFYLPGFMCTVVSAAVVLGLGLMKYKQIKKFINPREDKTFVPKLSEAESCYLNGCNCDDCRDADEQEYLPHYLFWNVPCKCYVDYCNKQSITDKQRFVMITSQNSPPTYAYHPQLRAQLASFANQCICNECPLCEGEECLCKGLARSRGVIIGEDDLVDRVGAYAIMQKRLQEYNERQIQISSDISGPQQKINEQNRIRTQFQDNSGQSQRPKEQTRIRTQFQDNSGQSQRPKEQNRIRTQTEGVEHAHSCNACGRDYTHIHSLGFNGVNHRQYDYQCPYEDCRNYHNGHHNSRKLYSEVNKTQISNNCWDEFEGLTEVQAKSKLADMSSRIGLQSYRANDLQAQDLIQNRLWPNILRLYVVKPDDDPDKIHRQLGHLLALGGNLFLTNYHFMLVLAQYPDFDIVIRQGVIVWRRMKASDFTRDYYRLDNKDAVVMRLDYKGNAFAKLTHHFLSKRCAFSHETQSVTITRYSMDKKGQMYPNPITTAGARLVSSLISIDVGDSRIKEKIVQPISWEYEAHTLPGDCGSPIVLLNSRIPTKIAAIHNAYADGLGTAFGVPIYQEEIDEAVNHFGRNCQYGWKDLLPVEDPSMLQFSDGDNFRVVSVIKGSLPQPSKSKLQHSPIFGKLTQTKTKPGYLRPFRNEKEELINPTLLSRRKWGHHLPTLDETKVHMCDSYLSQLLCRETSKDCLEYKIPMTTEQAIVGIQAVDGMPSMNKQSSPGYPYIFTKPPGKGKTGYFGQYEWNLNTPEAKVILDAISDMEREILNGNRPFVVSIDTLKDARIPIAKADAGKTRIFSAEPVDYCALHRKYFLPFIAHTMINRLDNSCAPGINAASPEFDYLAKLLRSKGNKVIAADYAQFDGRIPTEAIRSFYRAAKDWYLQYWDLIVEHKRNIVCGKELSQDEFVLFIERIAFECFNHVHVCEKQNEQGEKFLVFYLVMNGQASGNPGTAASNTGAGIWIIAYCYLTEVTPKRNTYLDSFNEDIYVCTYGDDMVMNVSDSLIEIFNQNVLTEAMMSNFTLECTDEQKSSDIPPPYRSLSEISFLKRSFIWNDDVSMYVGVLPVDLLYDITNWVRSGAQDPHVITVDNLKSIAAELALHGRKVFDGEMPKVRDAYRSIAHRSGKFICFGTYESYILGYRNGELNAQDIV